MRCENEKRKWHILREKFQKEEGVSWVFDSSHKELIIELAATRMKSVNDFKDLVLGILEKPNFTAQDKEIALNLLNFLETEEWNEEEFIDVLRKFNKNTKIDFKKIYYLITGRQEGLPLPELLKIRGGKKEFLLTFRNNIE